jgi:hypothetical protein
MMAGKLMDIKSCFMGIPFPMNDPTDTLTPFGELRGDLQDNYGMLVTPEGGRADRVAATSYKQKAEFSESRSSRSMQKET